MTLTLLDRVDADGRAAILGRNAAQVYLSRRGRR
jgi:hypothetical protein